MIFKKIFFLLVVSLFLFPHCNVNIQAEQEIFIRANQVGFLPGDIKSFVILSSGNIEGRKVEVKNNRTNKTVFAGRVPKNLGEYGNFKYSYVVDFSKVSGSGEYEIVIDDKESLSFSISNSAYNNLAEKLLEFFKVQRCGYTNPLLHEVCHIADATSIIEGTKVNGKPFDVTGGWHDAGDYVKFLNTTAFASYMLLFSYDFDPVKFGFDKDKNNVPDILEEAKIGLDWLLRCRYNKNKLITQVQDLRDHDNGWRLPENDPLGFDRPAFAGIGKNLIGIYSATLALASRIWKEKLNYPDFADKCLDAAESLYTINNSVPDVDSSGSGMYIDKSYEGKLALGAIELYLSTNKINYYKDAQTLADSAGADYWWSWGDINSLAHYRLAKFDARFADYIRKNLTEFNNKKENNLFGKGAELSWGTNNVLLGISLQNILLKRLTNESTFDTLSVYQRDFVLGRNPWGISFIFNAGKNYSRSFHHQINSIKGKLPGGFAAGPASKEFLKNYNIQYEKADAYSKFQTDDVYYRDDRMDYVTNEPTITGNATAIFVFGSSSN